MLTTVLIACTLAFNAHTTGPDSNKEVIEKIRLSTQKGMVIGNQRFVDQLEELHNRKVANLERGRPKK